MFVSNAPINSRAWDLQGRLLAPRVLNFAATQLFWECNELKASETFPFGMPQTYSFTREKNILCALSH